MREFYTNCVFSNYLSQLKLFRKYSEVKNLLTDP